MSDAERVAVLPRLPRDEGRAVYRHTPHGKPFQLGAHDDEPHGP